MVGWTTRCRHCGSRFERPPRFAYRVFCWDCFLAGLTQRLCLKASCRLPYTAKYQGQRLCEACMNERRRLRVVDDNPTDE